MRYLIIYCCWLFLTPVSAQARLQVKVMDKELNEGLIGANAVLYRKGSYVTGAATDYDGLAILPKVPAGSYRMEVKYTGYETQIIEALSLYADSTLQLRVDMGESYTVGCGWGRVPYDPPLIKVDDLTTGQTFTSTQIRPQTVQQPEHFRERANTLTVEPPVVRRRIPKRTYLRYRQPARMRRSPTSARARWARRVQLHVDHRCERLRIETPRLLKNITLYNALGQPIYHSAALARKQFSVPLTDLPAGRYTLVLGRKKKQVEGQVIW